MQRFYDEGWNTTTSSVYDELVAEDFTEYPGVPGLTGPRGLPPAERHLHGRRCPTSNVTVDQARRPRATASRAAGRRPERTRASSSASRPTGNTVNVTATLIYRIEDGQAEGGLDQPRRPRVDAPARRRPDARAPRNRRAETGQEHTVTWPVCASSSNRGPTPAARRRLARPFEAARGQTPVYARVFARLGDRPPGARRPAGRA